MPSRLLRPVVGSLLVAGVLTGCGAGDGGSVAGGLPSEGHVHALRAAEDGSLLLGLHGALWRSDDGRNWEALGLEGQDAMALGVAVEGAPLLVGGHNVLARSTDGGVSFEDLSPALPSLDIHALAQDPANPDRVYAFVVGHGLYVSADAGDTWTAGASVGDQLPGDVATMSVAPDDGDTVLVGSPGVGVLRSTDGGSTFVRVFDMGTIGLAHGSVGRVVAATVGGVEASDDGGENWEVLVPVDELDGQAIAVAVGADGTAWVITEQDRVLYRVGGDGSVEEVARA